MYIYIHVHIYIYVYAICDMMEGMFLNESMSGSLDCHIPQIDINMVLVVIQAYVLMSDQYGSSNLRMISGRLAGIRDHYRV